MHKEGGDITRMTIQIAILVDTIIERRVLVTSALTHMINTKQSELVVGI